ncbi:class I SAM-dependent methyltransferase [Altibacter sp. HG106]|uniref:class I SAM-dependent methyltransferase n=1 Tax=Altibacter sp. HG106 TaxID=3023937 RepID=UPI0023506DA2|nr:class I SAM-dependent methyltransferase [Altibacter sp. HG106]MDC7995004.1 class I SAM-dependent methyltransferase [Altibacter sp. HG106]
MIKKHWSPKYVYNRLQNYLFEKKHPELPWVNPTAITLLDSLLSPTDVGVEMGSGRSTVWYAQRCAQLTSIEDHKEWFDRIQGQLKAKKCENVTYLFKTAEGRSPEATPYVQFVNELPDASIDFIIVDGKHRDAIANTAIDKLKMGGILLLDDSHRYLPYSTTSPHALGPNPDNMEPSWSHFYETVKNWRSIWTTNGVTDTTFFIKK